MFSGTANAGMFCEMLQVLNRTRRTGEFILETPLQTFRIYLMEGRIVNATSKGFAAGHASFEAAIQATSGTYRFVERPTQIVETTISEPFEHVLLHALHAIDESRSRSHLNL